VDDVRFDEQVIIQKVGWKSVIGVDTAHSTSSQQNDLRTLRRHPFLNLGLASEIQCSSAWISQQLASFAPEPAHHSTSHHAVLTSNPHKLIGQIEEHRWIPPSGSFAD